MMQRPSATLALVASTVLLAACQTTGTAQSVSQNPQASSNPPAFVEAACGGCHAVEPPFLSPNPAAPSFEAIANRDALTQDTLGEWLADAHNYPQEMDFDLEREQIDQIAAYMVTLQRDNYEPAE